MRINYFSFVRYPSERANAIQIKNTCEALRKQGAEVFLYVCRPVLAPKEKYVKRLFLVNFFALHKNQLFYYLTWFQYLKWSLLIGLFDRTSVYYTRDAWVALLLHFIGRDVVFEIHGLQNSKTEARLIKAKIPLVAITSGIITDLKAKYGAIGQYIVSPDGVDVQQFGKMYDKVEMRRKYNLPVEARIAMYSGSFGYYDWKGLDVFLGAATFAKNVVFVAVGGKKEEIAKFRKEFPEDNIFFREKVSHECVPQLLACADVLVLPNKKGDVWSERYTSPIKLFEYMASDRPIVASDLPSIREVLDDSSALFFEPNNPESLAHALQMPMEGKAMKAKELLPKFDWSVRATGIMRFLEHVQQQLRLLVVTPLYPPQVGGPATFSRLLEEKFQGIIELVCFPVGYPKGVQHFLVFWKALLKGFRAQIVFSLDAFSVGFPSLVVAKIFRKQLIIKFVGSFAWEQGMQRFSVHDLLDAFVEKKYSFGLELLRNIELFTLKHADYVITPSQYLKEVLLKMGVEEKRIQVIYNSVHPSYAKASEGRPETFVLTSSGRLVPWKGFEVVIQAAVELKEELPNLVVEITGDGPDMQLLTQLVARLHAEDYIHLLGKKTQKENHTVIRNSNAFILNTGYEGMSHVLLEVMGLGVPILSTHAGGNREILEHNVNSLVFDYNSKEQIKDAIRKLYNDSECGVRLAENAKHTVSRFTEDTMLAEYQHFLTKIIK